MLDRPELGEHCRVGMVLKQSKNLAIVRGEPNMLIANGIGPIARPFCRVLGDKKMLRVTWVLLGLLAIAPFVPVEGAIAQQKVEENSRRITFQACAQV
jgi:hypothetical protein